MKKKFILEDDSQEFVINEDNRGNVSVVEPVFTSVALSTNKDPQTGLWSVIEIPYDPVTGQTGTVNKHISGHDRAIAVEQFKIMAANKGLVG